MIIHSVLSLPPLDHLFQPSHQDIELKPWSGLSNSLPLTLLMLYSAYLAKPNSGLESRSLFAFFLSFFFFGTIDLSTVFVWQIENIDVRVIPLAMMLVLCVGDRTNTAHKLSKEHIQALFLEDDRCQSSEKTGVKYCVSSGKGKEWQ